MCGVLFLLLLFFCAFSSWSCLLIYCCLPVTELTNSINSELIKEEENIVSDYIRLRETAPKKQLLCLYCTGFFFKKRQKP